MKLTKYLFTAALAGGIIYTSINQDTNVIAINATDGIELWNTTTISTMYQPSTITVAKDQSISGKPLPAKSLAKELIRTVYVVPDARSEPGSKINSLPSVVKLITPETGGVIEKAFFVAI